MHSIERGFFGKAIFGIASNTDKFPILGGGDSTSYLHHTTRVWCSVCTSVPRGRTLQPCLCLTTASGCSAVHHHLVIHLIRTAGLAWIH